VQILTLAGLRGLAVVGDAGIARSKNQFVGCGIADSPATGTPFSTMAIETQNSGMPVQIRVCHRGIDDPNSPLVQAREIVDGLFREPAFARAKQGFLEDGVDADRPPSRDRRQL